MTGTALYRFFDASDRLLYVGITSVGPQRWSEHEANRLWWSMVARTTVEHYPDRSTAAAAEVAAIRAEKPLHNVVHAGGPREPRPLVYRRHGEGTIVYQEERGGRWLVAVTLRGRRIFRRFLTEDDARLFLAAWQYRHASADARRKAIEVLEAGTNWDPPRSRQPAIRRIPPRG